MNKKFPKEEQRKYKRLDTIFPVEFQLLDNNFQSISNWHQGFSHDVSKKGICLTVNNLAKEDSQRLVALKTNLILQIHFPLSDKCFLAYASIVWIKRVQELPFEQFVIGVDFTKVDTQEIAKFLNYVSFKKVVWRLLQLLVIGILLSLILVITNNFRLNSRNLVLLNEYSRLLRQDLKLKDDYRRLLGEREALGKELNERNMKKEILKESIMKIEGARDKEIQISENELLEAKKSALDSEEDQNYIIQLKDKLDNLKDLKEEETKELQKAIAELQEQEKGLNVQLSQLIAKESEMKGGFMLVEREREELSESFKNQLYNWLKVHQNQRTGLVVSFEGDRNLKDTSYIYDQSLATIVYTLFGDYDKAKKGLDFFLLKADRKAEGSFYNAYYSNTGEASEYASHTGPNLWLGMAILQYTYKSKDYTYLAVAEQIAKWAQSLQDQEGGIVGGEGLTWYGTEHNLDAFAFFNMFYEFTKDSKYKDVADRILIWLEKYSFSNDSIPVKRGKGDSTIATDTYAWSITALGPERLNKIKMDPDKIIEFVIENCLVEAEFTDRFSKVIKLSGFDFAKYQHLARGGIISCEWTAQMILSFSIMSDYYFEKAELQKATYYQNEATKYLNELSKMAVSSPSAFGQGGLCMPYASQEDVDTGHGWRTPKGSHTGSVASTTYTIFAISKFNPLKLSK